jgi:hypothetical protein
VRGSMDFFDRHGTIRIVQHLADRAQLPGVSDSHSQPHVYYPRTSGGRTPTAIAGHRVEMVVRSLYH